MKKNDSGKGKKKWFKYVVEFKIDRGIIADGGDISNTDAHDMLSSRFPFTYSSEIKARVIEAPKRKAISKAQGY